MTSQGLIITGMAEAKAVLSAYASAAKEHASTVGYSVVASQIYSAGIETGRRAGGRVARKAGGLHFMSRAVDLVTHESLAQALGGQLPNNPDALRGVRLKLANRVASTAQKFLRPFPYSPKTRVHSGRLAASIHVVHGGEGSVLTAPLVGAVARTRRPR